MFDANALDDITLFQYRCLAHLCHLISKAILERNQYPGSDKLRLHFAIRCAFAG